MARILYLEDSAPLRKLATAQLRPHDVDAVETTMEAEVRLQQNTYDLLLSDQNLFGSPMSGEAFVRQYRGKIPAVMYSSDYCTSSLVEKAKHDLGVLDALMKPHPSLKQIIDAILTSKEYRILKDAMTRDPA